MYNFSFKKEKFKMAVHRDPSIRKHMHKAIKIVHALLTYPVPQSMITAGVPVGEPLNPADNDMITEMNFTPKNCPLSNSPGTSQNYTLSLRAGSMRM